MLSKIAFAIPFLCMSGLLYAKTLEVFPEQPLNIHIASHDYSRLAIQGGRVKSVIGQSHRYDLQYDKESGDLFIAPYSTKTFHLFIRTEKNEVLDINVIADDTVAQNIVLKPIHVDGGAVDHG